MKFHQKAIVVFILSLNCQTFTQFILLCIGILIYELFELMHKLSKIDEQRHDTEQAP